MHAGPPFVFHDFQSANLPIYHICPSANSVSIINPCPYVRFCCCSASGCALPCRARASARRRRPLLLRRLPRSVTFPDRSELRRRGRDRHRRTKATSCRAHARRFRGVRRRQAAENRDVFLRRAAGPTRRQVRHAGPSGSSRYPFERTAVRWTRLRHRARRSRHQPAAHIARRNTRRGSSSRNISVQTTSPPSSTRADAAMRRRTSPPIGSCCWRPSTSSSGAVSAPPPWRRSKGIITRN